ncbi:phospholipase A1-like isoform X4 [Cryptotermes secundus]|uniref:phospholipase A1-like isoform X4 n=1 Tax=Cryptotermes secundus TaxID=105785 RepID=UPI000CD7BD50|nr:phospholipase A1-like isoform X4 [Cryptotermes secundus]
MCYTLLFFTLLLLVSSSFCAKQKCCPDKECYELGDPWQTLTRLVPEPRCIEEPARYLFTNRSSPIFPFAFTTGNISKIPQFMDVTKPTVMVFHGWTGSETSSFMRNVTAVYLSRVDANAFFVDYGKAAFDLNYAQAVSDIRVVARYVVKMVHTIIQGGVSPSQIHLIGMSLGGQLAAYVAKAIPGIGRLTGDVDIWVNGGWDQPNCGLVGDPPAIRQLSAAQGVEDNLELFFCSHGRAIFYYTEALASSCRFWGVKRDPLSIWISRLTLGHATKFIVHPRNCTLQNCVPVGLDTIHATGRGSFIVPTNYRQPFCVSQ